MTGGRAKHDRAELTVELAGVPLAAGVSDRGHRRPRNEDAMAGSSVTRPDGLAVIAVVCDGVASVAHGDVAARIGARTANGALLRSVGEAPDLGRAAVAAAAAAADGVAGLVPRSDQGTRRVTVGAPSTTLALAVVTAELVVAGWVGDSRVYWLGERSSLLTADHALGGVLTRWLGADAGPVQAEITQYRPEGPGAVVVCSDGLWNYLPGPDELAEVALPLALTDPAAAATALASRALEAGGRDNVTVMVVPCPPRAAG